MIAVRPQNVLSVFCLGLLLAGGALPQAIADPPAEPPRLTLFSAGADGYHTFRIPALLVTPRGTLLAFCEGRKHGRGDSGDIDVVYKRSSDGGRTWSQLQLLWDDGPNTCGNPCIVAEARSGTLWLLMTHNLGSDSESDIVAGKSRGTRTVWIASSNDDGRTWSRPKEITAAVKKPEWSWYATGPGVGIQLRNGRLLIPCDHKADGGKTRRSHVIYSDDGGKTWTIGGIVGPDCNECQAAELSDGSVLLNIRTYRPNHFRRLIARSNDGGRSFTPPEEDRALIDPVCQASLLAVPGRRGELLFSNPASTRREHLTVRLSSDDGHSWSHARRLHEGPAAYSCLAVLPDGSFACLYEGGSRHPYEAIFFARFSRDWLVRQP